MPIRHSRRKHEIRPYTKEELDENSARDQESIYSILTNPAGRTLPAADGAGLLEFPSAPSSPGGSLPLGELSSLPLGSLPLGLVPELVDNKPETYQTESSLPRGSLPGGDLGSLPRGEQQIARIGPAPERTLRSVASESARDIVGMLAQYEWRKATPPSVAIEGTAIRRPLHFCDTVQDAHPAGEVQAYQILWAHAKRQGRADERGFLLELGLKARCAVLKSDSKKALRLFSALLEKHNIEIVTPGDRRTSKPTVFRILDFRMILHMRREMGLVWAVRVTSGVKLLDPETALAVFQDRVDPSGELVSLPRGKLGSLPGGSLPRGSLPHGELAKGVENEFTTWQSGSLPRGSLPLGQRARAFTGNPVCSIPSGASSNKSDDEKQEPHQEAATVFLSGYATARDAIKALYREKTGLLPEVSLMERLESLLAAGGHTWDDFLASLQPHVRGAWHTPAAFLTDKAKKLGREALESPPRLAPRPKCPECGNDKGEGAVFGPGGTIDPCPKCATPEWIEKVRSKFKTQEIPLPNTGEGSEPGGETG